MNEQPELPGMPGPKSLYMQMIDGDITHDEYDFRRRQERRQGTVNQIRGYDPDENPHVYGSYVPDRTSQHFKVHTSLGNARAATTRDMGGVYKLIAGHWELLEIRQQGQIIEEFE